MTALQSINTNDDDGDDDDNNNTGEGGGGAEEGDQRRKRTDDKRGLGSFLSRAVTYITRDLLAAHPALRTSVGKNRMGARLRVVCAIAFAEHELERTALHIKRLSSITEGLLDLKGGSPSSSTSVARKDRVLSVSARVENTRQQLGGVPRNIKKAGMPKGAEELALIYQAFAPPYPAPWEHEWRWKDAADVHPHGVG